MKALIDVNIVLEVLLDRAPFVAEPQVVWKANHERQIHGYVVATTLTNLFYIARRLVGSPIALRWICSKRSSRNFAGRICYTPFVVPIEPVTPNG